MKQLYKDKICSNCSNENCTHNIKESKIIEEEQISTVVKCADFICKDKRKKKPLECQRWGKGEI